MLLETLAVAAKAGTETRTAEGTAGEIGRSDSTSIQSPEERDRLPKDVIFELLSVERRRLLLEYMAENGRETTLRDLAEHIAAIENGIDARIVSSKQRKRVYVGLYQCHLPKLNDANVIDFDSSRGTVTLRAEAEALYFYLELDPAGTNGDGLEGSLPVFRKLLVVCTNLVEWILE